MHWRRLRQVIWTWFAKGREALDWKLIAKSTDEIHFGVIRGEVVVVSNGVNRYFKHERAIFIAKQGGTAEKFSVPFRGGFLFVKK